MTARILIIDASVQRTVQTVEKLRPDFPDPITVDSVASALPRIRLQPPDLIILGNDPTRDPGPRLRRLRSERAGLDMPIILIGDAPKRPVATGLLRLGADAALPDHCSGPSLRVKIAALLVRRDQLRQAQSAVEPRLWAMSESAELFDGPPKASKS